MKIRLLILICVLAALNTKSFSENPKKISILFELSGNQVNSTLNEKWNIRQDVGSYYSYYNSSGGSVMPDMFITHLAVKPEISLLDNKLAISTGLIFSNVLSDLNIVDNGLNSTGFFYLRYNSTGSTTEYAKVHSITESSNYLGIPFDLKFIPFTAGNFDFYLKVGYQLGFKMSSETKIDFVSESMDQYQSAILQSIGLTTNNLYSAWTNAIGVTYGKRDKTRYNFEILLPSFINTQNNSTITIPNVYTGFRLSIQVPIKSR
ncbi:MAG: hypothetical protein WCL70_00895 [Paludibacter sp.]